MTKILGTFLFSLFSICGYGQLSQPHMRIWFEDQSVFFGEVIEMDEAYASLRIITGDTVRFSLHQAKEIVFPDDAIFFKNGTFFPVKGRFWNFGIGFNPISIQGSEDVPVASHISFSYGWHLNKKVDLSLGFGFEFNEAQVGGFEFDTQFAPVFIDARYFLTDNRRRLFLSGRLAYGFPGEEEMEDQVREHEGGIHASYGLGMTFASGNENRFSIQVSHYMQATNGTEFFLDGFGNEIKTEYDILINRLILRLGWDF